MDKKAFDEESDIEERFMVMLADAAMLALFPPFIVGDISTEGLSTLIANEQA